MRKINRIVLPNCNKKLFKPKQKVESNKKNQPSRFTLKYVYDTFAPVLVQSKVVQDQIVDFVVGNKRKRKDRKSNYRGIQNEVVYIDYPVEYIIAKNEHTICGEPSLRRWIHALHYAQVPLHEVEQLQPLINYIFFLFPKCDILVTHFPKSLFFRDLLLAVGSLGTPSSLNDGFHMPRCEAIVGCLTVLVKYQKIDALLFCRGFCDSFRICLLAIFYDVSSVLEAFVGTVDSPKEFDRLVNLCVLHNRNKCLNVVLTKAHSMVEDPSHLFVRACELNRWESMMTLLYFFRTSISNLAVRSCFQHQISSECAVLICSVIKLSFEDALACLIYSARKCDLYAMQVIICKYNISCHNLSFSDTMSIMVSSHISVTVLLHANFLIENCLDAIIYLNDHHRYDCIKALITPRENAWKFALKNIEKIHQQNSSQFLT